MKKKIITIISLLFLCAAIGTAYYFYSQWKEAITAPEVKVEKEVAEIVKIISKTVILPEGEEPTLATVLDREKLGDQPFFKNAENGDRVLMYNEARKAILYRPSTKKVIEIAPIVFDENANASSSVQFDS